MKKLSSYLSFFLRTLRPSRSDSERYPARGMSTSTAATKFTTPKTFLYLIKCCCQISNDVIDVIHWQAFTVASLFPYSPHWGIPIIYRIKVNPSRNTNSAFKRSVADPRNFAADPYLWLMDPDSVTFVSDLQVVKKNYPKFFCLLLFKGTFTSFFTGKRSKRSHKTIWIKVFLLFLLDERRIRIHTSDKWIRIREAQKHVDPVDPDSDPEHCWEQIQMLAIIEMGCQTSFLPYST